MKKYRVSPGKSFKLKRYNPAETGNFGRGNDGEDQAEKETRRILSNLDDLQVKLYASKKQAVLMVLQGMDTAGKDGTVKHVMEGVNPTGCVVNSFKVPNAEEMAHDYLWRVHRKTPEKGYIGIFNRSHYEDVLVTRVHGMVSDKEARRRFKEINHFEYLLARNGTVILKFFLHISKEEQRLRLEARAREPHKRWKFSLNDIKERKYWPHYQRVYQEAIQATSTEYAPWYVVPSDNKWYRNWVVGKILIDTLDGMKLKFPPNEPGVDFKKIKVP